MGSLFLVFNDGSFESNLTKAILFLVMFCSLGMIIPCTTQEIGSNAGYYLKRYKFAQTVLRFTHWMYRLPVWISLPFRSFAAIDAARVSILSNDLPQAEEWMATARSMAPNENWGMKFRINVTSGEIKFLKGDFEKAKNYLHQAVQLHEENKEHFKALREELSEYQVRNLDLLGQLALADDDLVLANAYFQLGIELRKEINTLRNTAAAYELYWRSLKSAAKGDLNGAESHAVEAVSKLRAKQKLIQDREVCVGVVRTLKTLGMSLA